MSFTIDEVIQIIQIVKECKDCELTMDLGDMKLSLAKGEVGESSRAAQDFSKSICVVKPPELKSASPVATETIVAKAEASSEARPAAPKQDEAVEEGLVPVEANVTSVFYRKPSPAEPPFVEVGDEVKEDTVVCLLEVMKCFYQVAAGVRGRIEKICVESGNLVETGAVLFLIRPA